MYSRMEMFALPVRVGGAIVAVGSVYVYSGTFSLFKGVEFAMLEVLLCCAW